ncbi:HAD-IB family phosphatase [Calothrix sp. NIES-3974]|uniref:HAD-IB family phosphatase n=1 Tax=Calothrix sp. NIES-3974 TaxID=2005462 RepID=UPI000B61CF14|nr:HAD-IB family phosphatase [Calothrix sp. NIES-3974]BAZ04177.1 HAD-superfamily hydrolase [Calothrix sp. NIES-3974]
MEKAVFCDFDGTITAEETFVAVLKKFAPELAAEIIPSMYALQIPLRVGVRQILESIPSRRYGEIIEFTRTKKIRPGFREFVDFLHLSEVPLIVVSGGIKGMVEAVLGDLVDRIHAIHALDINTAGENLQVISAWEGESELVDKVKVMASYNGENAIREASSLQLIAIGDSVTDLNMAIASPIVFARDRLAQYLDQRQKNYLPWNDFFDIRDTLTRMWQL